MKRLKKILFPTDFSSCARAALVPAVELAEQYQTELHLFHAIVLHGYDPYNPKFNIKDLEDEIHRRIALDAADRLANEAPDGLADAVKVVTAYDRGFSSSALILNYAAKNDIDLIVMGTHGRRAPAHFLLGSVAAEVVRSAGCPVLTVREPAEPEAVTETARILVPVDFSKHSQQALSYGKHLAATNGATLQVLHVFEQILPQAYQFVGQASLFEIDSDLRERSHQKLLEAAAEAPGPEVRTEPHVVEGRATSSIVQFATDNDSDLIVIPTHGLTGLSRFLLGSVTQKVVRRAPCPVLVVKAFGKSLV
jgi:nucleotide-binding universal stress UspA family protein